MREILVVGAGPAGLIAAAQAARLGAEVEVIEEHKEVGIPEHCAGLVSSRGMGSLNAPGGSIIGKIRGAKVFSPSGKEYRIMGGETKALVIDRPKFDLDMLKVAEDSGVKVSLGTPYSPSMERMVLLNAEGINGRVARSLGMGIPKSIPAAQMDIEAHNFETDVVELHTGEWAPRFFAWVIPRRDGVRVGLAARSGVPLQLLKRLVERNGHISERLKGARVSKTLFGKVVVGGPLDMCVVGNSVAIGDAGGFVKPTTGGGVILGGLTAAMAGRAAAATVLEGRRLADFSRDWKRVYGSEFRTMRVAAKVFSKMSSIEIERALESIEKAGLLDMLTSYDMDLQRSVIARTMRSGLLIHSLLPLVKSIFSD